MNVIINKLTNFFVETEMESETQRMIIVFAFAPVDNYQKRLDETEFEMYRKRSVIIGSIEAVIGMTAMLLKCDILVRAILISLSYVGASLIVGYILNIKKHI